MGKRSLPVLVAAEVKQARCMIGLRGRVTGKRR